MATFADEDRLPPVPLPTLEGSCARFVEWCAPLLSAPELAATEAVVGSFLAPGAPAHGLQAELAEVAAAAGVGNWLDRFWSDRYLGRRDRIALNANFSLLLARRGDDQVDAAARLIAAAVAYKALLDEEAVDPVVHRGHTLSMERHKFLFSATRIPRPGCDIIRSPYSEAWPGPSRRRHVVVFVKGQPVSMDVIRPDGRAYTVDELIAGLRAILAHPMLDRRARAPLGHLTAAPRAAWAEHRVALLSHHRANGELLDIVETALFCVCLDDTEPCDEREACAQLLHGDSANRWFDKAVSMIVFADGTAGLNCEHACLDGTTAIDFVEALAGTGIPPRRNDVAASASGGPPIAPLQFQLDAELEAAVHAASAAFAAAADATATAVATVEGFGARRVRRLGMSPDAFVQMAFQVAHHRVRGFVGSTYESISMRHFRHGRTEAMRVVTPDVLRLVDVMADADADTATRRSALVAAGGTHAERTAACRAGLAPEQHLWELQLIEQRRCAPAGPRRFDLYDSPGWLKLRDDYLSTSSTPSSEVRYCGFGPTGSRCIGVAYMVGADRLSLHASAPGPLAAQLDGFVAELRKVLGELESLFGTTSCR